MSSAISAPPVELHLLLCDIRDRFYVMPSPFWHDVAVVTVSVKPSMLFGCLIFYSAGAQYEGVGGGVQDGQGRVGAWGGGNEESANRMPNNMIHSMTFNSENHSVDAGRLVQSLHISY